MGKKKIIEQDLSREKNVVCVEIKKGRNKLSPAQSEFNRLNKKIAVLKSDIHELPEREQVVKAFFAEQAASLFEEERDLTLRLLERLDEIYEGKMKLTKKEKALLPDLVLKEMEHVDDFVFTEEQQQRVDELRNKYLDLQSGMTREEREQEAVDTALMYCSMMEIKPNAKMKKAKTEAEFEDALQDYMFKVWEKEAQEEDRNAQKRNEKKGPFFDKKEKKLSKSELKQKLQEEQAMKSIRQIYIELVKELHPDKEMNEETRLLKEERMKLLTKAYQAKDLASLLRMQIEWLEESSVSPEAQTDDILKRYNKVLRSQLKRLEEEYFLMCNAPFPGVMGAYGGFRKYKLNVLKGELSAMREMHVLELDGMREYVAAFSKNSGVKSILKKFGQAQAFDQDDIFDFLDSFLQSSY